MNRKWYVLNVHSGKEELVAQKIKSAVKAMGLKKYIGDIFIPKRSTIIVKEGKKISKKKRLLPGYILVHMVYNETTAPLLQNIEEVRGFLRVGNKVFPLTQEEVDELMSKKKVSANKDVAYEADIRVGDAIKIKDGAFKDFIGKVAEVDYNKGKVKVLITILGRETPYDIDINQVQKL